MRIEYRGEHKKYNIYSNNHFVGRISKKNRIIEVQNSDIKIKEVLTGFRVIDYFLYGLIGLIYVFANYVDEEDLADCSIVLLTVKTNQTEDIIIDECGILNQKADYILRSHIFISSIIIYSLLELLSIFIVVRKMMINDGLVRSMSLLIGLIVFIAYFYVIVHMIVKYDKYKKFIKERINDIDGR